jgi:hypothetical protein
MKKGLWMGQRLLLPVALLILLIWPGCENNFSPIGGYNKQLVVYGVLSNRSDSQYVRIYTNYNPSGNDLSEQTTDTGVHGAIVTMMDDSTTYRFKETAIPRDTTIRYSSDIVGYVGFPCRLRPGKIYSLAINSDQGRATALVYVPSHGFLFVNTPKSLTDPRSALDDISVTLGISPWARGYLVRLFINFDVMVGQNWEHRKVEVPSFGDSLMTPGAYGYPTLTIGPSGSTSTVVFRREAYLGILKQQIERPYGSSFTLTTATFVLTQVDQNLFNYYNTVNGYQDLYTIRLDQLDFTNINRGVGLFGAMVEDSTEVWIQGLY